MKKKGNVNDINNRKFNNNSNRNNIMHNRKSSKEERLEKIKKIINDKESIILKILFVLASVMFAVPSIIYYINNKTVFQFDQWFKFLLNNTDRFEQTIIYLIVLTILTILYIVLIKNKKKVFKNTKRMFIFIAIIAIIFIAVIPFTCSDVFYYLGIGRINSEYRQNPYYTTIKDFVDTGDNSKYLVQDSVLAQGYINDWADSTVVYGPIWTLICNIVAGLSFGNIDIGLLVFKSINVIVHIFNCYLIYKITNKKIFALIYGLNPFVLIEGIACVHNDMFVVLFILLTLYFLLKRKNLIVSLVFLALATTIKYFPILLLPFIIIYYFRKEKPLKRFGKCIQYGLIFAVFMLIPYLLYIRDIEVFAGIFTQQEKLAKSIYIIVTEYFGSIPNVVNQLKKLLLGAFVIIYAAVCIVLLNKKEISFRNQMRKYEYFLVAFLFLLITNFQPWYILWLFPCMMWQKSEDINTIIRNISN